jgi:hypothetical protein
MKTSKHVDIPNWHPGMQELSYEDIRQVATAHRLIQEDRFSMEPILVHFADGACVLPRRRVIWNILFWGILVSYGEPILMSKHIFPVTGITDVKTVAKVRTYLYKELIHKPNVNQDTLTTTLWEQINELNRFVRIELSEYQETISMLDLAQIVEDPKVKELVEGDVPMVKGIPYIERRIARIEKELGKLLSTPGLLQNDALYHMQNAGVLNPGQVRQMLGPLGVKTDVNESVILHYIPHSVTHGMRSIKDYATESFSARKATFYSHDAIEKSQYFGRRQHLITSTIRKVYDHDCGSQVYLPFMVTEQNYKNLEGKFIFHEGQLLTLTLSNLPKYIGKIIHMRSPLTCLHTDGICKTCGGELMEYISDKLDIGIIAAISVVEPTSQKILSTKHYSNTSSVGYELHPIAEEFFKVENNYIYFKEDWIKESDKWTLGIPHDNIRSMHDLLHIDGSMNIRERIFSTMSNVVVMDVNGKMINIPLMTDVTVPFMTRRALLYLKSKYAEIQVDDDFIWVPMKGLKDVKRFPFLKTTVINDSMMAFVDSITGFLTKNIATYRSVSVALEDFSKLVYAKVQVNIMHLEVLLKAYLVTSGDNYDTPIVTDPENVLFAKMEDIISSRTIGAELAFERLRGYFSKVNTYVVPKTISPLDKLIGI